MSDAAADKLWAIFFQSIIPVWGLIGLLVVVSYGRASHQNWRSVGGTWAHVPVEWLRVVKFVFGGCLRDLWWMLRLRGLPPEAPPLVGYKPGHLLQFFVVLSFSLAAISGAVTWSADRSSWSDLLRVITGMGVTFSIVAGWGHLFLAWRVRPRRWRWMVAGTFLYVPVMVLLRA